MITLTPWLRAELIRRADAEAPQECCGLISQPGFLSRRFALWGAENVAENPESNFEIAADNQLELLREIGRQGETLVGIYHSHSGTPDPSQGDFDTAMRWPGLIWVIIGRKECEDCDGVGEDRIDAAAEAQADPTERQPIGPCESCGGTCTVPDFWIGSLP